MSHTTAPPKFLGNLTGVSFRPAEVKPIVYEHITPGDTFRLEREQDNPHDENAVKVLFDLKRYPTPDEWYGPQDGLILDPEEESKRLSGTVDIEVFCGFIERGVAASLARWMDEGFVYIAKAKSRIDHKMTPWLLEIEPTGEQVEVEEESNPGGRYINSGFSDLDDDDIPF